MALVVDDTPGGATANSYADVALGDTYHEAHLYMTSWEDASEDEKGRALVTATRMLDTWFDWVGTVASDTQALRWPRIDAYDPDGRLLASDEIPAAIANGTIELARELLAGNREADSDTETQGIKSVKAGSVDIEFKESVTSKPIPDAVQSMLSHYGTIRSRSGSGSVLVQRG